MSARHAVRHIHYSIINKAVVGYCPRCSMYIDKIDSHDTCVMCGQSVSWSLIESIKDRLKGNKENLPWDIE